MKAQDDTPALPRAYSDAVNSSEGKLWKDAMDYELAKLEEMNTWSDIDEQDVPPGAQVLPVSRSTLASITRHYASSAYPRRDYKFGQILSRFLSFALPFADTNDHHGTTSYVI